MSASEKRIDELKKLLGCKTDSDLARRLPSATKQQVWRWRYTGFHGSATEELIDELIKLARKKR